MSNILKKLIIQGLHSFIRTSRGVATMSIEVEQKFYFDLKTEEKLVMLGAICLRDVSQYDIYYDNPGYELTCLDHWLRKRNDNWELKCPPEIRQDTTNTTQYLEFNSELEIVSKICAALKVKGANVALENILHKANCTPFAHILTHRKTYQLDDIIIDLDKVDYGYCLGEIEVIVNKHQDIPLANSKIQKLAVKIGK